MREKPFSQQELYVVVLFFATILVLMHIIVFFFYGYFYECVCTSECVRFNANECLGIEDYPDQVLVDPENIEVIDGRINV